MAKNEVVIHTSTEMHLTEKTLERKATNKRINNIIPFMWSPGIDNSNLIWKNSKGGCLWWLDWLGRDMGNFWEDRNMIDLCP